jgi:prepilin-type N-terminal cleavage/methylation domain-containing protein
MKKGFTLVELLAVVVLIGLLTLIIVPVVDSSVKKGKEKAYNLQKETIIAAARSWVTDNKSLISDGDTLNLTLLNLKEQGYLDFDIKNPTTGVCLDNTMQVTVIRTDKKYNYQIIGDELTDGTTNDCDAIGKSPTIYLIGSNPYNIEINTSFVDPGAVATDTDGNDISSNITTSGSINTSVLGKNKKYNYTVLLNGQTKTIIRSINIVDTIAPVITGVSDSNLDITAISFDIMAGISATDNSGEMITVKTKSNLTLGVKGTYQITYIASDSSGNTKTVQKNVYITNSADPSLYPAGVNRPILASGMTPVKWDSSNNEIVTTESDPAWYDYTNKKWANAKTADGSYWVWIPRYAYKITSGYHSSTAGTISIKFLKGFSNLSMDGTQIETSGYAAGTKDTSTNYFLHPAFVSDKNILGFWVAKYEPTAAEGVANAYADGSCPTAGDNVTTKTVKITPNAISWRCIDVKTAYNLTLNMKNGSVYGWGSSNIDSHMMKNTEWGAVAYLTQSTYGANTEVWINNANNYMTGCSANSVNQGPSTTGCLNTYNTANGIKASTTSNITGIYDMSGGAWEMTVGNYNNLANGGFNTTEITNLPNKYINRYVTAAGNLLNGYGMDYDSTIYGDAVYETSGAIDRYNGSSWVGTEYGSWYTDYSYIPHSFSPWFNRGGSFGNTFAAGVFNFGNTSGGISGNFTFRHVVVTN